MKNNYKIVVVFLLIILYFACSLFIKPKKILVYSNNTYIVNKNSISSYDYMKLNNKKLNVMYYDKTINQGYFRVINEGNSKFSMYDENNKAIDTYDYSYAYTDNINPASYSERESLTKDESTAITKVFQEYDIDGDLSDLNYIKVVELNNAEKLIFFGNFNDDNYYSVMSLPDTEKCYEFVIKVDNKTNYEVLYENEVEGTDILDENFIIFDCVMNLFDDDSYQIGVNSIIYSFHETVPGKIYNLSNNNFDIMSEKGN